MGTRGVATLRRLARAHGVQLAYTDLEGRRREASPEALLEVLRVLGAPLERVEDAKEALAAHRAARMARLVEPVIVLALGRAATTRVRLSAGGVPPALDATIALESGETRHTALELDAAPVVAEEDGTVVLEVALPADLPEGYHRLHLEGGGRSGESTLIVAPPKTFHPRGAASRRELGVVMPLYALGAESGRGVGHLGDLEALVDWAAAVGAATVGTLPLLAAFLDANPYEPSPYAPVSRRFFNEIYLDVEALPELAASRRARELLASPGFRDGAAALRAEPLVDYRAANDLIVPVLDALAETVFEPEHRWRVGIEAWADEHPLALEYARFRGAVAARGESWWVWPEPMRAGRIRDDDVDPVARRRHLYAQWAMDRQLEALALHAREKGTELYLDLPVGVHPDGFDVFHDREVFALGVSAGAPPDPFFTGGQDWGFPPLHPARSREHGHRYFAECVRAHLAHAGRLRIDHVMGLHRLYLVPRGLGPLDGVYVSYPAHELHAVLCIESHRHQAEIVGENLGTVPHAVDVAMRRHAIQGMYMGEFSVDPERGPIDPPAGSLAALNTHDMPTFAGFWHADDVGSRVELGFLDPGAADGEHAMRARQREALVSALRREGLIEGEATDEAVLSAWLTWLGRGPARTVLVNLEDLWLERAPQNVPGTHREVPNWRHKARRDLDAIRSDDDVRRVLERVVAARRSGSGR